jgi:hypothetical protein
MYENGDGDSVSAATSHMNIDPRAPRNRNKRSILYPFVVRYPNEYNEIPVRVSRPDKSQKTPATLTGNESSILSSNEE